MDALTPGAVQTTVIAPKADGSAAGDALLTTLRVVLYVPGPGPGPENLSECQEPTAPANATPAPPPATPPATPAGLALPGDAGKGTAAAAPAPSYRVDLRVLQVRGCRGGHESERAACCADCAYCRLTGA
jgi:hypothetical protein